MRYIGLVTSLFALPISAQVRSTELIGPAAMGASCYVRHVMPSGLAGHIAGFQISVAHPGAIAVSVPGFGVSGLLLVDPATYFLYGLSFTDGVTMPTVGISIPRDYYLLGAQFDCQSFDLDASNTFHLAGNDVTLMLVDGPGFFSNMVPIAPGTFGMGSSTVGPVALPMRFVTITRPFWIGKFEVTQAEYQSLMVSNPSFFQGANWPNAPQRPVEAVSWGQAMNYCAALNFRESAAGRVPSGYQYRLPTEAEWEYCCRAGTTTDWSTGASIGCFQANFDGCGANQTRIVGSTAANAWGLWDMHGNVWEWCFDSWDGVADYSAAPLVDPFYSVAHSNKVLRGGGFDLGGSFSRSAFRWSGPPAASYYSWGFRVVLAPVLMP